MTASREEITKLRTGKKRGGIMPIDSKGIDKSSTANSGYMSAPNTKDAADGVKYAYLDVGKTDARPIVNRAAGAGRAPPKDHDAGAYNRGSQ